MRHRAPRPPALRPLAARYRARLRARRTVLDMPDIGVDELEFLIRTQWLAESEAADRRAVGCAIARAVTQN